MVRASHVTVATCKLGGRGPSVLIALLEAAALRVLCSHSDLFDKQCRVHSYPHQRLCSYVGVSRARELHLFHVRNPE
jgi:hypothetical protein